MLKKSLLLTTVILFSIISVASATDIRRHLSIEKALANGKVKNALLPEVALYFSGQQHPEVLKDFGEFKVSKRTNTFMKDKVESCEWAFAAALLKLQYNALNYGGNAVINISSNIRNRRNPSSIQFDCLIGSMMVNVAFHANIVELAQ